MEDYCNYCHRAYHILQHNADTEGQEITGDVTINGKAMSKSFFLDNAAYVPQEDRLWSALTGDGLLYPLHVIWYSLSRVRTRILPILQCDHSQSVASQHTDR